MPAHSAFLAESADLVTQVIDTRVDLRIVEDHLPNLVDRVQDGAVVSSAEKTTDFDERQARVQFPGQVDRVVSGECQPLVAPWANQLSPADLM